MDTKESAAAESIKKLAERTTYSVLLAISFAHLINDVLQALVPSLYPMLRDDLQLSYSQLGLITLVFQCTASLFQPVIGYVTDKYPFPYSLVAGMAMTMVGLLALSVSHQFSMVLLSVAMIGFGSAVFHPEASRVAFMASGGKRGMAQSLFQVGGNGGYAFGPLLAALFIVPRGQGALAWSALLAGLGIMVLWWVGCWTSSRLKEICRFGKSNITLPGSMLPKHKVVFALLILVALIFSKYVYMASMTSFYTFYMIERFGISIQQSQVLLFVFLFAIALGTIMGGPIGDKIGRKRVIWASILGVAPFALWLPHAGYVTTIVLTVIIGVILASAFSAILVYAQELVPGKVGLIAGLFFGLAFGIAGVGSAVLGNMADHIGIEAVYQMCAYLPLIGLLTAFLPDPGKG